jgi:hypothetical protein
MRYLRDLRYNEKRVVIAGFLAVSLVFTANYFLGLGLVASRAKGTMILAWVLTVLIGLYIDPRPDGHIVIPLEAGCVMCGQPFASDDPVGTLEVRRGRRGYWSASVHVTCLRNALRPEVAATVAAPDSPTTRITASEPRAP